jgi:putative DNA primase/helicase
MTNRASMQDFSVPDDLAELDQWVLWRYETKAGRRTKVPFQLSGVAADVSDRRTWSSFETALHVWRRQARRYAGLGFVFSKEDNFAGIDLDHSLDERGDVKKWARGIVERFGDSYMEVSPSGGGLKIWAAGSLPANLPGVTVEGGSIEMYDHGRYFAVTGRVFRGAPLQVEEHTADLLALYNRLTKNRRKGWPVQPLAGGRIPHGRQHNTLVSICGTLRLRNICDRAIEACLQEVNANQCEKPGTRDEIRRIVESTRKWGAR